MKILNYSPGLVLLALGLATAHAQQREVAPLPSLAPLIERVAPAVVNISVIQVVEVPQRPSRGRGGFNLDELLRPGPGATEQPPQLEQAGAGSGVIVDAERGYVLTNHHVVEDASDILVTLVDNRSFEATVLGMDSHSDLAVLQIEPDQLTEIPITTDDDLKVGDYVVAIGNPYGFSNTVTAGIVSGLGRQFVNDRWFYEDFIQTDASINPGNSGGALVNLDGQLVGINSAIISETGGNVGIGFAIPSKMVVAIMDRLLETGDVKRSLLGINIESVTPGFAADYGLSVEAGALVMNVGEGSAAERAGIEINDVIVGVAGRAVADRNELRNTVALIPPGEAVDVRIVRGNRERTLSAVLDLNEEIEAEDGERREPLPRLAPLDGLQLSEVPAREGGPGLRIDDITPTNQRLYELFASDALQRGDLITAINQRPVTTLAAAEAQVADKRNIILEIMRDSRPQLVRLR